MTAIALAPAARPERMAAGVVTLLAISVFINYVDRGNFATAAPLMKDALGLTNTQVGVMISAFFWVYAPGQFLAGWLAERVSAYLVLAVGLAVWSMATVLTGLAGGFATLLALRLLLGLGECAAFPCSSKLLAQHLPSHELGKANGVIAVGLGLGPAFGTLGGGLIMIQIGWRGSFILFGLLSLLWLWPWLTVTRRARRQGAAASSPGTAPTFGAIIRRRAAWGVALGQFCGNYSFYFVVSWLPLYLVKARGFSVAHMAQLGGLVYLVYAAAAFATGWACDRWMVAGASANKVHKSVIVTAYIGTAVCFIACAVGGATLSVAALLVVAVFFGLGTTTLYAIGQTLAGPRAAGKWIGFQNGVANLAGIVGPIITGLVVDRTGGYGWAFAIAAVIALIGVIGWGVIVPKVAPLDWSGARLITGADRPAA